MPAVSEEADVIQLADDDMIIINEDKKTETQAGGSDGVVTDMMDDAKTEPLELAEMIRSGDAESVDPDIDQAIDQARVMALTEADLAALQGDRYLIQECTEGRGIVSIVGRFEITFDSLLTNMIFAKEAEVNVSGRNPKFAKALIPAEIAEILEQDAHLRHQFS